MTLAEARAALVALGTGVPDRPGRVTLDLSGPIARLTIDNPTARNAITVRMMVELADAVAALAAWDGAMVVVTGTGGAFCAGGHLGDVRESLLVDGAGLAMARAMTVVLDGLLSLPVVSVAAIGGPALGGGAEIATACDFRVVQRGAYVHFVHVALGVAPGWGGAGRLAAILGRSPALRVLTTAARLDAAAAVAIGFADRADDDAVAGALEFLAPVASQPTAAVRAAKAQIAGERSTEAHVFASVWGSSDHRVALARMRG
jgi:ethylmalonyl-CoA/methylmalonyl-CoA decarboxylase